MNPLGQGTGSEQGVAQDPEWGAFRKVLGEGSGYKKEEVSHVGDEWTSTPG